MALEKLGRTEIPVTVIDLKKVIDGEYAENFFRQAFAPSEMVDIAAALEPDERQRAKERQAAKGGKGRIASGKFPEAIKGNALDHVARIVGKDRKTDRQRAGPSSGRGKKRNAGANLAQPVDRGKARDQLAAVLGIGGGPLTDGLGAIATSSRLHRARLVIR